MNVYLRETRAQAKSLLFWCLGMVFLIGATMAKYQGLGTAAQFNELMAQLPGPVLAIFSMNMLDIGSAKGFYGVAFLFLALMAAVHAVLLGSGILSKEERDRTSEFLFAKPVTRAQVLTSKALAALTGVVVLNLATYVSSLVIVNQYGNGEDASGYISLLMGGMFFIQLIFLSVGLLAAAVTSRPKAASGIATEFMLVTFLLSTVIDINTDLAPLKYLTPFKYFDAKPIYASMGLEPLFMGLSVAIVLVCTAAAYWFFRRRDLRI